MQALFKYISFVQRQLEATLALGWTPGLLDYCSAIIAKFPVDLNSGSHF
jgi:hypothetical protein